MNIYNGNLDEISTEQVIVTDRDIYRKVGNINDKPLLVKWLSK